MIDATPLDFWARDTQHRTRQVVQRVEDGLQAEVNALVDLGVPPREALREVALAAYRWGQRTRDDVIP